MYPYLPAHWTLGDGLKTVTFKQLLTHQSGFVDKNYGSDYASLKKLVSEGLVDSKKPQKYNNANFALMRFLITTLADYSITNIHDGYPPNSDRSETSSGVR